MIRLIIILSLAPLSGCIMNKFIDDKLVEIKASEVNEITDVRENTQYVRASFDLDASQLMGYGGSFMYGSSKFGNLDVRLKLNSSSPILNKNEMSFDTQYSNYNSNDRLGYSLSYGFPLIVKFETKRRGITLSRDESDSNSRNYSSSKLIFFSDRKIRNTLSIQAGFKNWYTSFDTRDFMAYNLIDKEQYESITQYNPTYFDDRYYRIFAQSTFISIGGRLTRTFSSSASIEHKGYTYRGANDQIIQVNTNILVGLSSNVRPFKTGDPDWDISESVSYQRLGIEVSLSSTTFGLPFLVSNEANVGIGFFPGYHDNLGNSFFLNLGISFGIGKLWTPK